MPPAPPDAVSVVLPQNVPPPETVTAEGIGVTVATTTAKHPVALSVYEIFTVPADTPNNDPVVLPIVAITVLALAHVPPDVADASGVGEPTHTSGVPVIGSGLGLIVTVTEPSGPQQPEDDCERK